MADNTDPRSRQASREASGWMIRLQDDPDNAELRRQFDDWLTDPVNGAAWTETQRMVQAVAGATPVHAERWRPFLGRVRAEAESARRPGPSRRLHRRWVLRVAVAAAAASILAVLAGPDLALHLEADYTTRTAETRTVRLADDSIVTLAPDSAISVAYAAPERRIRLLAGEAYFEAAPDAGRPFRVFVDAVRVTVLGTAFNVARSDEGADVGVAHGIVRVDYDGAAQPVAERLKAGEFVRVSRSGGVLRGEQPASQIAAWRERRLVAQDQPLGEVVDRLRRYYFGAIVVTDAALAGQPVTGVYDLGNPAGALRGIARSQNAVVREITPWLLVVSRS
jgi:transmembrane sensor